MKRVILSLVLVILLVGSCLLAACRPRPTPTPTPTPVEVTPTPTPTPVEVTPTPVKPTPIPGVKYTFVNTPYRTGPFAITGVPLANAAVDYFNWVNEIRGGVDGYRINFIEVETGYETPRMVEAYERTKGEGIVFGFIPASTGGVYAVTPKAFKDRIPVLHPGWGISAAASGKAFPWNYLAFATYWSQAAAILKYIAEREGGEAMLKGKKIALVYLDIDYGRETIPLYERLSKEFGFELLKYPIPWPGLEQAAVWSEIAVKTKPDWVVTRLYGMSSSVAMKEADRVGYPMSKILNPHPSMTETDIWAFEPQKAAGVKRAVSVLAGTDFPIIQEILRELYDKGKGAGPRKHVGIYLYNLFIYTSGLGVAALKKAADKFGHPLTPEQIKWGYDHLTYEDLKYAGIAELAPPRFKITPEDHEGGGWACIVEWDGTKWVKVTDWVAPYRDIVKALVEEAAEKFIKEHPELYR